MIPCRHYRHVYNQTANTKEYQWCSAYLLQVMHHPHKGLVAVVAYDDKEWGCENGMKVELEESMSHVRIARTRIPLHDTVPTAPAKKLPDAAK